jgi:hypothetical protein
MGGRLVGIADFCWAWAVPVVILGGAVCPGYVCRLQPIQGADRTAGEAGDGARAHHRGRLPAGAVPEAGRRHRGLSHASFPGASRPQMATLKRLEVRVQLLPLLSHRINIDRLALTAPIFFWRPT